jgi:hypothetical protein
VETSLIITVQLEDQFGNVATAGVGGVTLNLSTTSPGGMFFNTATTATITSVKIAAGKSTASFRYQDIVGSQQPTLTVSATGLTSATQQETIM